MQGISREEFIAGVARDIQTKIPEPFDMPLLKKEIGIPSPTQVVLLQEIERWNRVLVVMSTSLKDLQRALTGEIGFSSALEDLSNRYAIRRRYNIPVKVFCFDNILIAAL